MHLPARRNPVNSSQDGHTRGNFHLPVGAGAHWTLCFVCPSSTVACHLLLGISDSETVNGKHRTQFRYPSCCMWNTCWHPAVCSDYQHESPTFLPRPQPAHTGVQASTFLCTMQDVLPSMHRATGTLTTGSYPLPTQLLASFAAESATCDGLGPVAEVPGMEPVTRCM
jgi:hypothetical protein